MKTRTLLFTAALTVIIAAYSCKTVGRIAAKYWLKREIKEFVSNCEDKTSGLIGSENAHKYCDCAVDLVAEKYQDYKDAKRLSRMDIVNFVNQCK